MVCGISGVVKVAYDLYALLAAVIHGFAGSRVAYDDLAALRRKGVDRLVYLAVSMRRGGHELRGGIHYLSAERRSVHNLNGVEH